MCLKQPQGQGLIHRHCPCVCFQVFCCLQQPHGEDFKVLPGRGRSKAVENACQQDWQRQIQSRFEEIGGCCWAIWRRMVRAWASLSDRCTCHCESESVVLCIHSYINPGVFSVPVWLLSKIPGPDLSTETVLELIPRLPSDIAGPHASFRTMPAASFAEYLLLERLLLLIRACTARDGIHPIHKRL